MKRPLLFLLVGCLALNGCMDLKIDMNLNPDWSGTAVIQMEMLDQLFQMVKGQAGETGADLYFLDQATLRAKLEEDGGTLRKFSNTAEEGKRKLYLEFTFRDARTLAKKSGRGQLSFMQEGDVWRMSIMDNETAGTFQVMGQEELEQQISLMQSMMSGMKWHFQLKVPQVTETNLQRKGNQVLYQVDFNNDIANKRGKPAAEAYRNLMAVKWLRLKGMKK